MLSSDLWRLALPWIGESPDRSSVKTPFPSPICGFRFRWTSKLPRPLSHELFMTSFCAPLLASRRAPDFYANLFPPCFCPSSPAPRMNLPLTYTACPSSLPKPCGSESIRFRFQVFKRPPLSLLRIANATSVFRSTPSNFSPGCSPTTRGFSCWHLSPGRSSRNALSLFFTG